MPDLLLVFAKRWKLMLVITFLAVAIASVITLFVPKQYLSVATALPVNSVTADKARMFNPNIQELYSDFGSPDELDRFEGTATLDTIFIAASKEFHLPEHYSINDNAESFFKAVQKLKKNSKIERSSYGELKVKVWDRDRNIAAAIANFLMQKLQEIHQHLQNESNISALKNIEQAYISKQREYLQLADSLNNRKADASNENLMEAKAEIIKTKRLVLAEQLQEYEKMMGQYQLAVTTNAPVLLIVESARPPVWADKPDVLSTVLFTFFSALLFSFFLALFIESRNQSA